MQVTRIGCALSSGAGRHVLQSNSWWTHTTDARTAHHFRENQCGTKISDGPNEWKTARCCDRDSAGALESSIACPARSLPGFWKVENGN